MTNTSSQHIRHWLDLGQNKNSLCARLCVLKFCKQDSQYTPNFYCQWFPSICRLSPRHLLTSSFMLASLSTVAIDAARGSLGSAPGTCFVTTRSYAFVIVNTLSLASPHNRNHSPLSLQLWLPVMMMMWMTACRIQRITTITFDSKHLCTANPTPLTPMIIIFIWNIIHVKFKHMQSRESLVHLSVVFQFKNEIAFFRVFAKEGDSAFSDIIKVMETWSVGYHWK